MDNPSQESNAPLDTNQAAEVFSNLLGASANEETAQEESQEVAAERLAAEEVTQSEPEAQAEESNVDRIPVEIDGKTIELTKEQIADAYKNGLRQQDYTKKTMEAAELRKAADAEVSQARAERQQYANQLQNIQQQLQGALQEQNQIDWQQLLNTDPVEYLKQQHLYQQRHAALQTAKQEQQKVEQQQQAEKAENFKNFVRTQQQELLAKLPEWKDESKADAEKSALAKHMIEDRGFTKAEVDNIVDHRVVILAREAMKYKELMAKAKEAAKKVAPLPPKVERPGNGNASKPDGRSAAFQKLAKSGRVEDAAAVFAGFL